YCIRTYPAGISERTKEALAEARAGGVRLGRPRAVPDEVVARIHSERDKGNTLAGIAAGLNADDIPTAHGGAQWHHSTIRAVLART
ncbi:MAG: recombinase family protein, partial [Acidimicrobiia bacterium]